MEVDVSIFFFSTANQVKMMHMEKYFINSSVGTLNGFTDTYKGVSQSFSVHPFYLNGITL